MRIYTKTGDDGTTGLFGGDRVSKSSVLVEAYGTVDELSSIIGSVRVEAEGLEIDAILGQIQDDLFCLGAELACQEGHQARLPSRRVGDDATGELERWMDRLEADLPPLRHFVLPGGTRLAATLHQARTVCRRAERRVVALGTGDSERARLLVYLNRLSDLLFVLARHANQLAGRPDVLWVPERS